MAKTQEQEARYSQEKAKLDTITPKNLPDSPSQAGWSAPRIKKKMYDGFYYLHNLIEDARIDLENEHFTKEETEQKIEEVLDEDYAKKQFVLDATSYVGTDAPDPSKAKVWVDVQGVVGDGLSYSKDQAYEETEYTFNTINPNEELHFNN